MNFSILLSNINFLAAGILTIFSFMLGALWHSKLLFGEIWAEEINLDKASVKKKATIIFSTTAIVHFITIASLSAVISGLGALQGMIIGIVISLVWIVPAIIATYVFANKSFKLIAIDAGMYVVLFTISGLVLGVWF